jgi:NTP pyrophosphatase (non-canonical NTP hydrolase)
MSIHPFEQLAKEQKVMIWHLIQERKEQDSKWGTQDHDDLYWLAILMEEVGELAREVIEGHKLSMSHELIQSGAVCLAWLECKYRREQAENDKHGSK